MAKNFRNSIQEDCSAVLDGNINFLAKLKNQCLFITGGTGFMGTWLTEMVSFLNDYYNFNIKLFLLSERAHEFSAKAPYLAMRKDVVLLSRGITSLTEIPDEVTMIIHAAASPDNRLHASEPLNTTHVIVNGTTALLAAASRLSSLKGLINVSSGLIYGAQPDDMAAISETYSGAPDCSSVSSAYAEAKRFAESLCGIYRNQYKMPIINVRPFAFVGPYQLLDRPWAINNFLRDSLLGNTIRILGNGETIRSYMYPSDMAFWLLRILVAGTVGASYNIGSPFGISLRQVAEKIASYFPEKRTIISGISQEASQNHSRFVPSIQFVQDTLEVKITVDIDTAIRKTLDWNRSLLSGRI